MSWSPQIRQRLDQIKASPKQNKIAVFDLDGTIWNSDVGEAFFDFQVRNKLASPLQNFPDPWDYYKKLELSNVVGAYGWLAQINKGYLESDLRKIASEFHSKHFSGKIHPAVRDLIHELRSANIEVWICTASIRWAVEPILPELCVLPENLIAVEVVVDPKGILTDIIVPPLPYGQGKKVALETLLKEPPVLVVGNSRGDLDMLGLATEMSLVVGFEPRRKEISESEDYLREYATKKGWPIQIFT